MGRYELTSVSGFPGFGINIICATFRLTNALHNRWKIKVVLTYLWSPSKSSAERPTCRSSW